MTKRFFAALLAALITFSLAACGGDKPDGPASQGGNGDFQKNMHQAGGFGCWLTNICETDAGIYFGYGPLYYLGKEKKQVTVVCNKPECDHTDSTCNARGIDGESLWLYGDKLYYITDDFTVENGKRVNDYGRRVFSVNPDGTDREVVQDLDFEVGGDNTFSVNAPIFHRGYVYFVYNNVLYAAPLGAELKEAKEVWSPEPQQTQMQNGFPVITGNEPHYTLWADGEQMYFMVNTEQPDGAYLDTLFSYNPETEETKQVWVTPNADEVGEWETTGVSVSQWYVLDGYIYFFLSQNGLWRCSLESGEYEKLADTTDKVEYGTAIFSDDYLCILNDAPQTLEGKIVIGSPIHEGGDAIFVYKLDGTFVKELPLTALTDEASVLGAFMLFNTGNMICFMADVGTVGSPTDVGTSSDGNVSMSVTGKDVGYILCCLDIETGELTQLCKFDH